MNDPIQPAADETTQPPAEGVTVPTSAPAPPAPPPDSAASTSGERPSWQRWSLIVVAVIALAFVALWWWQGRQSGGETVPPTAAVAVVTEAPTAPPTATAPATPAGQAMAAIGGPTAGTVGQALTFSGAGSTAPSEIVIYSWDFGDGTQDAGVQVAHTYDLAGNFVVRLTVQDASGQVGMARQEVVIQAAPEQPPSAVISGPTAAQVGQSITFSATASTAPQGATLTAYAWTFGDGAQGTGQTVSHAFAQAGNYYVVLNVTDSAGLSDSASQQVVVTAVATPQPPKAIIQGPSSGTVGQMLTFDASGSTSDSPITAYNWQFGDGGSTNAVVAKYAYDAPGSYTVSLTLTNQAGQQGTASQPIQIAAAPSTPPKAVISGPSAAVVGQAAAFNASGSTAGTAPIVGYAWTVNGLPVGSGATLSYIFPTPGQFTVEVVVTDQGGQSDSAGQAVTVSPDMASVVWVLDSSSPPITLSAYNGHGTGTAGCNTYQFSFTVATPGAPSGQIAAGSIVSSQRQCDPAVMTQEQQYLATLQAVTSYAISGRQMQLTGPAGTLSFTMQ